jgi:hypothetical protein
MANARIPATRPHVLQATFFRALDDQFARIVTERLVSKAATQGYRFSARQRRALHESVVAKNFDDLQLPGRIPRGGDTIRLAWTRADTKDLQRAALRLRSQLPHLIRTESEILSGEILATLKARWKHQATYENRQHREFKTRLERRWQGPLKGLSMMLTITREFSQMVGEHLEQSRTSENEHLIAVLTRLHVRACQITAEILTLLRDGFADGAMARWRTLHEIAVVAMFVRDRGDAIAERYLLHDAVESFKAMRAYRAHSRRLRLPSIRARAMHAATKRVDSLVARFGKPFLGDYGWASETPTEKPTFSMLEAKLLLEYWRPFYRLASHSVHANPKGIFFKLGLVPGTNLLLTGSSNYGLADSGQNTALTLNHVTAALATVAPTLDTLVFLKLLARLSEEVADDFVRVQRDIESEERDRKS